MKPIHPGAPCATPGALMHTRLSTIGRKSGGERVRNRYDGRCTFCGAIVLAGQGCVEKNPDGSWSIFC